MSLAVNTIYKLLGQWLIGITMESQVLVWLQQLNRTQLYSTRNHFIAYYAT